MSAPTEQDIAAVDAGINDRLVEAATEQRDPVPQVADMQNERDWLAAAGDFDAAEAMDARYLQWASPQLTAERELGDR